MTGRSSTKCILTWFSASFNTQAPAKAAGSKPESLTFDDDDDSEADGDEHVMDVDHIVADDDAGGEDDAAARAGQSALQTNEEYLRSRTRAKWSSDDEEEEEEDEEASGEKGGEESAEGDVEEREEASGEEEEEEEESALQKPQSEDGGAAQEQSHAGTTPLLEDVPDASETGRLFVRNLPFTAGEDDIRVHFEQVGQVKGVHLVLDHATKKSRGVAFVEFVVTDDAGKALQTLDGSIFQGRLLHVLPGRAAPAAVPPTPDQVRHSFCFWLLLFIQHWHMCTPQPHGCLCLFVFVCVDLCLCLCVV